MIDRRPSPQVSGVAEYPAPYIANGATSAARAIYLAVPRSDPVYPASDSGRQCGMGCFRVRLLATTRRVLSLSLWIPGPLCAVPLSGCARKLPRSHRTGTEERGRRISRVGGAPSRPAFAPGAPRRIPSNSIEPRRPRHSPIALTARSRAFSGGCWRHMVAQIGQMALGLRSPERAFEEIDPALSVRRERRWSTAGESPARELVRSTR